MRTAAFAGMLLLATFLSAQEIPAGTALPVTLESQLDTRKMEAGQGIVARVAQNVPLPSNRVIRAGSRLEGRVVKSGVDKDGNSYLVFKLDVVVADGRKFAVATKLRALASPVDVEDAQLPRNLAARAETDATWTTVQVGGDDVYRGGGHVMHGERVVGDPVAGGVLAELLAVPDSGCDYGSEGSRMALWVFSSVACGSYGLKISVRNTNLGEIVLSKPKKVHVPKGSGMLLIVIEATQTAH